MQHPQHFVQNLIQIRSHYQSLQDELERSTSHMQQQLSNVNALLIDQVVENQQFAQNLIQMRSHYQLLHQQQQQKVDDAREQLHRVNALLAEQLVLQYQEQEPLSHQAAALEEREQRAIVGTVDNQPQLLQLLVKDEQVVSEPESLKQQQQESETSALDTQQLNATSTVSQIEQSQVVQPSQASDAAQPVETSQKGQASIQEQVRQFPQLKRPLLAQYANLTKQQAVEQVLRENSGSILDIPFVIYALHGKMEPEELKEEKSRMYDTLKKGVEKGKWDRVPGSPGCYTFDLKLVGSKSDKPEPKNNKNNQQQGQKSRGNNTEQLLPHYQNMSFSEAVEEVVRDNVGQVLTTEKVAKELYGSHLEGSALTQAKAKVGKTLWTGAKQGLWERVPNKLGTYTLDLVELEKA